MAGRTLKVRNTVIDQRDMKTLFSVKKHANITRSLMNKKQKMHVMLQELYEKHCGFDWDIYWSEFEKRMEHNWGGRWKAIGKDKYSKTLTQIKNGEKDE